MEDNKNFDIKEIFNSRLGENYDLHSKYLNRTLAKVLKTISFDRVYKSAKGCYLYDQEGNDYLDFLSGYGVFGIGRNHPVIAKAIKDVLDMDIPNMVQLDCSILSGLLAEALIKITPSNLEAVFFCNSGTESIEGAMKFARASTKRNKILSIKNDYHGLSYGSLSLTHNAHFQDDFGTMLGGCEGVNFNDLEDLENKLKQKDVAALIFEPVQGKGVKYPSDDYFPKAQALCKKYGTLFIADEVQTGLGRTGKMWGFEHWNLTPDIITVAKTLSGGYAPVAAFITTRKIHQDTFSSLDKCVIHSTTFGRNNLSMACGLATLSVLKNENLVEKSKIQGEKIVQRLKQLQKKHSMITEIRGKGLMIAIDFQKPNASLKDKVAWKLLGAIDEGLFPQMIVTPMLENHRILTQVAAHGANTVKILPPYIITDVEIDKFINALDDVLSNMGNIVSKMLSFAKKSVL